MTKRKVIPFNKSSEFYYEKGIKKLEQNKKSEALNMLAKAFKLNSHDLGIIAQYAYALAENHQMNEAEQLLIDKFIKHNYDAEYYFIFSQLFLIDGDANKSFLFGMKYATEFPELEYEKELEQMFDVGVESESQVQKESDMFVGQHIFQHLFMNGKIDQALNYLNTLSNNIQETRVFRNLRAMVLLFNNDFEESYTILEQLIKEDKTDMHALSHLTLLYYHTGNEKKYREYLKKLEVVQPIDDDSKFKIGLVLNFLGKYKSAYDLLYPLYRKQKFISFQLFNALSLSSYNIGLKKDAQDYWDQMQRFHPVSEKFSPWKRQEAKHLVDNIESIYLFDDDLYYRLLGIFKLSQIEPKDVIIGHPIWDAIENLNNYEKMYISHVFQGLKLKRLGLMHKGLVQLYSFNIFDDDALLTWIEIYHRLYEKEVEISDIDAFLAAVLYYGRKENDTKKKYMDQFNISRYRFDKAFKAIKQNE